MQELHHSCHRKSQNPPTTFSAIENSPIDVINFKLHEYTAHQLAEAFSRMAQEDFDWPIKRQALDSWNAILSDLLEEPLLRETEFDLVPIVNILDDLLFRRALREHCGVAWVDVLLGPVDKSDVGSSQDGSYIRGWRHGICIVRPSAKDPKTVQNCLTTLMHEMCHALLSVACQCAVCSCSLNEMNGEGVTGHGPTWQMLARAVEDCVNGWLKGFGEPFRLLYLEDDGDLEYERMSKVRLLGGLYKAIKERETDAAREKKEERGRRRAERWRNTAEGDGKEKVENETLACVRLLFE